MYFWIVIFQDTYILMKYVLVAVSIIHLIRLCKGRNATNKKKVKEAQKFFVIVRGSGNK